MPFVSVENSILIIILQTNTDISEQRKTKWKLELLGINSQDGSLSYFNKKVRAVRHGLFVLYVIVFSISNV